MNSAVLVATWEDGVFVVSGATRERELATHSVRGLTSDGRGGALAIVDGRSLYRRASDGGWSAIAIADLNLACCVAVGDTIYAGTEDARVMRVSAAGTIDQLQGFDNVAGRNAWYAGAAMIDGMLQGPPLGIRSITATSDGAVLLANVHVGGVPRSVDGGMTWQPTLEIDTDVHEVRAHPDRPGIVAAAAAVGLCTSGDGGATWEIEEAGLHAPHCSAVAFAGDDILVAAETDPFATEGAIYRKGASERGLLSRVAGGLPEWLDGIADTGCIASRGSAVAIADSEGNLYVSMDCGLTWSRWAEGIPTPSSVHIV